MKNNKGFTIVELLVSFTLSMVLVIIMFQLIINLKDLYISSGVKTELLSKQYIITNKIYTDLIEKKVTALSGCLGKPECITFSFQDGTTKTLDIDMDENMLTYGDYVIKLTEESYYTTASISTVGYTSGRGNNRILTIDIPIYNHRFNNINFGIRIVYPYNSQEVTDTYN